MTCYTNCIHCYVCKCADTVEYKDAEAMKADCEHFKNKADFVEVPCRCKDCVKHGMGDCIVNRKMSICDHATTTKADAFCSEGKRKANNERS